MVFRPALSSPHPLPLSHPCLSHHQSQGTRPPPPPQSFSPSPPSSPLRPLKFFGLKFWEVKATSSLGNSFSACLKHQIGPSIDNRWSHVLRNRRKNVNKVWLSVGGNVLAGTPYSRLSSDAGRFWEPLSSSLLCVYSNPHCTATSRVLFFSAYLLRQYEKILFLRWYQALWPSEE